MSRKRLLFLFLVVVMLLSSVTTPLLRPTIAVAASPDTPSNVSPSDGATDVSLTPTLQSSSFSDPDLFDIHTASQWQITMRSGDYFDPLFDSGRDRSHLTVIVVPSGMLSYSATYYWHVRYRDNHKHWSEWSPETPFTTVSSPGDVAVPVAVTDLAAIGSTSNSVTLTWTAPGDDGNSGAASSYDIRYSTATITDANWGSAIQCNGEPVPKVAGSNETFTIPGLSPDTTYYLSMKTADEVPNWSALSNVAINNTDTADILPPLVNTSAATGVDITSATLNGNLTGLGAASSVQISFEWGLSISYGNTTLTQKTTSTGTFSEGLAGLTAKTTYHFRAKAVGNGTAYGEDIAFTTNSISAPVVTTSAASNLAATSATLNGDLAAVGTAASVIVSYQWGVTAAYGAETTAQSMSAMGTFSTVLNGLSASTTYHYRAKAVGDGYPVYGDDLTLTTASLTDTTAPVITGRHRNIAANGATITWTTDEVATSQVDYGLTEEYDSTSTPDTSLVTSHSVDLTGLKTGKTYHYRLRSKDAANNEAISADMTFITAARTGGGTPTWASVIIVIAVLAVGGGVICLIFKKPMR
jgi:hypothetical protein